MGRASDRRDRRHELPRDQRWFYFAVSREETVQLAMGDVPNRLQADAADLYQQFLQKDDRD